jgi:GTPase Era involved in 16S rRNA processing
VPEVLVELLSYARIASVLSKDQLTDKPERFFVNETIREKYY